MAELTFDKLKALLPKIHEAQALFDTRMEVLDSSADDAMDQLREAFIEYNAVLHEALEICIEETADRNNASTMRLVFSPKDELQLYFGSMNPARFLQGVADFKSFNSDYHERRRRELELAPATEQDEPSMSM